jgi:hypothetical protein
MRRLVTIAHVLLPLLVAGAAAGVRLQVGETGSGLPLLMLGGALLGGAVALMLESVAAMLGLLRDDAGASQRQRGALQREKEALLRSIKDIENDGALGKVEPEQAAQLTEPLRARAVEVLRELEQAQQRERAGIEEQIERELARRAGGEERT